MNAVRSPIRAFWDDPRRRTFALIAGGFLALLLAFCFGVLVGGRAFGRFGPGALFFRTGPRPFGPPAGAVGLVTAINPVAITISNDRSSESQVFQISEETQIERSRGVGIRLEEIHVGDRVVVIGAPEGGTVRARFIRLVGNPLDPGVAGSNPGAQ